jgi:hypothetical protein
LARTLDVSPQELRRPAKAEEPALAEKGEAPREAGPEERLPEGAEEDVRIPPVAPERLKQHINLIKSLKEELETEIEDVREEVERGGAPRDTWPFHLEADAERLETIHREEEIRAYVDDVLAGGRMTMPPTQQLCREFSREWSDFRKLTDWAMSLYGEERAISDVEGKKGMSKMEAYIHDNTPGQRDAES